MVVPQSPLSTTAASLTASLGVNNPASHHPKPTKDSMVILNMTYKLEKIFFLTFEDVSKISEGF